MQSMLISKSIVSLCTTACILGTSTIGFAQDATTMVTTEPVTKSVVYEPDTQFKPEKWFDKVFTNSGKRIKKIPGNFKKDMKLTGEKMKNIFKDGVKVGNVLIVKGGPETAEILKKRGKEVGIHYRDAIKMMPQHLVDAGGHIVQGGKDVGKHATENARSTGAFTKKQFNKFKEDQKLTKELMTDLYKWSIRNYKEAGKTMGENYVDIYKDQIDYQKDLFSEFVDIEKNILKWTGDEIDFSLDRSKRQITDLYKWTLAQGPEGLKWTKDKTKIMAGLTKDWTVAMAKDLSADVKLQVKEAGEDISSTYKSISPAIKKASDQTLDLRARFHSQMKPLYSTINENTFKKIPSEFKKDMERTRRVQKQLWDWGINKGFKGKMEAAGDQYFKGGYSGITIGTAYAVEAASLGVATVLVLEPVTTVANAGFGLVKTVGLATGGALAEGGIGIADGVGQAGILAGGYTYTGGVAAFKGMQLAGQTLWSGTKITATAGLGGLKTAGAAVGGGLATAGVFTGGLLRTGGLITAGTAGTIGRSVYGGLEVGGIGLAGGLGMAGVGVGAIGMSAGGLGVAGLRGVTNTTIGAVKMSGITVAGIGGEILIPTVDLAVQSGRLAAVTGKAVWENVLKTPSQATFDIVKALTLGGWEITKDPILGTYSLVAGTTGFAYRLVGLTTAEALTGSIGALYSISKMPVSLVYNGTQWLVAAGAKVIEGLLSPFNFNKQNEWRKERSPQVQEMLDKQPQSIKDKIGSKVEYVRVIFSGFDRGKTKFFTTKKNGKVLKFKRKVDKNDCSISYKNKKMNVDIKSGYTDRRCHEKSIGQL